MRKIRDDVVIVAFTQTNSRTIPLKASQAGADEFFLHPLNYGELQIVLSRAIEKRALELEGRRLLQQVESKAAFHGLVGGSAAMQKVYQAVEAVAGTGASVVLRGESGVGKELVAQAIVQCGDRADHPFVCLNCSALPETLMESELFGYEKGAFTGALRSKQGLLQSADTGTIFLDEVGELPLEMQAKLLRFLQEKEVRPVGSNQKVKVDVRIMAATNRDLDTEYQKGTFRKDLYFRLNVVTISLPPLRERRSDIPILAAFFLERLAPGRGVQVSGNAMKAMLAYDWPGNVRELENCLERAVALGDQRIIEINDLPPAIARAEVQTEPRDSAGFSGRATDLRATDLEDIERATIERVFSQVKGDKALAGRMLGISRATLYRKLKRYNIGGGREEPPSSTTLQ